MATRIAVFVLAGSVIGGTLVPPAHAQRAASQNNAAGVQALLFDLANAMGMLRGLQQEDSIITLEHWMTGTATTGQQRVELTEFRVSANYMVPGLRVDMTRKEPDGRTRRAIEVVAGTRAWNEADRGRDATAAQDAAVQRLVALWTTPMGVVKAARAAGADATLSTTGGVTVLSFPLPSPAAAVTVHATVRRDASLAVANSSAPKNIVGTYIARVTSSGPVVVDITYAEYGDWNWDDYKADIMLPRRTVSRLGDTTLELTTKNTNTYNPYVVMPVPENIREAGSQ
jgi:hypothetical protein